MSQSAPRKIAVWLQLEPHQPMRGEGIGEHLMRLLTGIQELGGPRVVLCAPRWAGPVVHDMVASHGFDRSLVKVRLFGFSAPHLNLFSKRKPQTESDPLPLWYARRVVDVPMWTLALLLAIIASPALLLLWTLGKLLRRFIRQPLTALRSRFTPILHALTYAEMARYIDRSNEIDGVIVPIGNWFYCRYIEKKPIAVQIPDVIFMEFPNLWRGDAGALAALERIRYVGEHAGAVVTPSAYVKNTHLVRGLGLPDEKVFVVEHAPMRSDLDFAKICLNRRLPPTRESAIQICREFQQKALQGPAYHKRVGLSAYWLSRVRDKSIWNRPLLYYPTQYRPYKNLEQVIRAVARLRDDHNLQVTLLVTGDLSESGEASQLIDFLRLHDQVVPLPRVPHLQHAALYAAANLAISASSFEGGMPFTFGEAVMVDTPCLMARIPVTLEQIHGPITEQMMFDPDDVGDLTSKIQQALKDPKLLARQKSLLNQVFGNRTWTDVAKDYLKALEHARSTPRRSDDPFDDSSPDARQRLIGEQAQRNRQR